MILNHHLKYLWFFLLLVGLFAWPNAASGLDQPARLQASDCRKCHIKEIEIIQAQGGRHRDAVTCVGCHQEHPPKGADPIPACAQCHKPHQMKHFAVSNCMGCHPAHRPLEITVENVLRASPACTSCHYQAAVEMNNYPSNHSVLDCKECHREHGQYFKCLQCHQPHEDGQGSSACTTCHQPHKPLRVTYENNLPSSACTTCHGKQGAQLGISETKHQFLSCVYCHKNQHKLIPACTTCHGKPHSPGIHGQYPECNTCHGGAHDLVN